MTESQQICSTTMTMMIGDYNVMLMLVERVRTRVILGRGGMFTKERDPIMSNNMSMIGATFHTYEEGSDVLGFPSQTIKGFPVDSHLHK